MECAPLFSCRYIMNIWNNVFLVLIFITSIAVVALTSVEFQIRNTGQKTIADLEKKIEDTKGKITKIDDGAAPLKLLPEKAFSDLGFEEIRGVLRVRLVERGRAWFGSVVDRVDEKTLPPALPQVEARVIITEPFEEGETTDTVVMPATLRGIVYVFEEENNSDENIAGVFLGRFNVNSEPIAAKFTDNEGNEKNGWRITMVTIDPISEKEIEQIKISKSRWAIYMTPPVDRFLGVFNQLTDEEMQTIPDEIREKFQLRPMPELATEDLEGLDPRVVEIWKKYREEMDDPESERTQDYSTLLVWLYQQRNSLNREMEMIESYIKTHEEATKKNEENNKKLKSDCDLEEKRVTAMTQQRDAVGKLCEEYAAENNKQAALIETLHAQSKEYIDGIMDAQLKVIKKIEEQPKDSE